MFGRVTEEDGVGRFLGKDVNGSLNVPAAENETIDELLSNVIVGEERKPKH